MTDRELLELAAKAAGYEVEVDHKGVVHIHEGTRPQSWRPWNPLNDDGDALRLAVKLGIEPRFIDNSHSNGVEPSRVTLHNISGIVEKVGDDSYAATRRAIVRAAAEIGRNMK